MTLHAATDAATDAPTDAATEAPAPPPARGARLVLRSVLGLVLLVVLVWAASHPRLRRIEEWLGLRQVLTAGFAFVALGVIARQPAVGILSDDVLDDLTPVLHFALGWL
ncbi:MAG: hypothetical protein H6719_00235, partial [Sandaracinaceae bacterium]|nr:hypothetical protein [Sandaracinaceae bacterium]